MENNNERKGSSPFKIFGFNLLGIVLGIICGTLAYYIVGFIMSLLGSIPLIANLLSWPVDFEWYALVGVFTADIFVGIGICKWFCERVYTNYNYGVIILSIITFLRYVSGFIQNIINTGFSFSLLFIYLLAFGSIIVAFSGSYENEA